MKDAGDRRLGSTPARDHHEGSNFLVHHTLTSGSRVWPDKEAWGDGAHRLTYREAATRVRSLAQGFRSAGMRPGDRAVIWLDHSTESAMALFAVSMAGGVFVPVHATLHAPHVAALARDCGAFAIITTHDRLLSLTGLTGALPDLRFRVCLGGPVAGHGVHAWEELCSAESRADLRDERVGSDLAAIVYTSGSSGSPKGVMHSHAGLLSGAKMSALMLGITPSDRVLCIVRFSFIGGIGMLLYCADRMCSMVITSFVIGSRIATALAAERISVFSANSLVWPLLASPVFELAHRSLPHLRLVTSGGGPPPLDALRSIRGLFPQVWILSTYAQTECCRSTSITLEELERRPGSIGKPVPDAEIFPIDERGEPCAPDEVGELVLRNPSLALGYWARPEETGRAWRVDRTILRASGAESIVFHTGDFGKIDMDGYLHFVGRRDAMIKTYGYRISRTSVEQALLGHDALDSAAVVGVPDDERGQAIVAFVVCKSGSDTDRTRLMQHCLGHMERHMVPRRIEVVDSLPTLGSGKIDYRELARRAGA